MNVRINESTGLKVIFVCLSKLILYLNAYRVCLRSTVVTACFHTNMCIRVHEKETGFSACGHERVVKFVITETEYRFQTITTS